MPEKELFSVLSYFWIGDRIQRRGKAEHTQKKNPLLKLALRTGFSALNIIHRKHADGFLNKIMQY